MQAVSAEFATLVVGSHTSVTAATVVEPDGTETSLEVLDGQVDIDRTRDVRRSCTVTLADPDGTLTPDDATDLLAPFGNELRLERGIVLADGSVELVPLGVFRLTDMRIVDGPDGVTITLAGFDRSLVVIRNRFVDPYVTGTGAVADVIAVLLADRYPSVQTNLPSMGTATVKVVLEAGASSNPWDDARKIARAHGWELSFDATGVVVATRPASPSDTPAFTIDADSGVVLLELEREVSTAASVYNGVIAEGEGTGLAAPVRGQAWDDDPESPMYSGYPDALGESAFGAVPLFYRSPLLETEGQAQTAAETRFAGLAGATEAISWGQLVHPALEADDVVRVTRDRAGLSAVNVVLDAVTVPLSPSEQMKASGRRPFS